MSARREYFVYRLFDKDGDLLYIGCTNDLVRRWSEHWGQRPEMAARVARCRKQGPYTRDVARLIERRGSESEHPLYGWTSLKQSLIQTRYAWERRRTADLFASGLDFASAQEQASFDVFEKFGPRPSYYQPWCPSAAAS